MQEGGLSLLVMPDKHKMNVLITGISGFVGHFLTRELLASGHRVCGFDLPDRQLPQGVSAMAAGSITDHQAVSEAVRRLQPDACVHLAGIASPPVGRKHPELMLNTNILGTTHILESLREWAPQARFLLASTAYVYGNPTSETIVSEATPLRPNGIYAVSKVAADLMTLGYSQDYNMHTMTARAANHTGPGQSTDFVVPAFARQIISISSGEQTTIHVGNLESERSFLDVRDVVRAYRMLIESGISGKAYNVATSTRVTIRWILETLAAIAGITPQIEIDPEKYRPTDRTPILDTTSIQQDTGWKQQIELRETLREICNAIRA